MSTPTPKFALRRALPGRGRGPSHSVRPRPLQVKHTNKYAKTQSHRAKAPHVAFSLTSQSKAIEDVTMLQLHGYGRGHSQQQQHQEATSKNPGGDLWAKAAELERQFAGYKQRLAEKKTVSNADADADAGDGDGEEEEMARSDGRGRMYEVYMRRRDERLREGWRARMERKEAEMKALWARLQSGGGRSWSSGSASPSPVREQKVDIVEEKRSSDVTPRCISVRKHSLARSLSTTTSSPKPSNPDSRRRALLQESPQAQSPTAFSDPRKENRMPSTATATTTTTANAASRPKTLLRTMSSVKEQGSFKAGQKPPRSQPPRISSGDPGDLKELVGANSDAVSGAQSNSNEQVVLNEIQKSATSKPFLRRGNGIGPSAGAAKVRASSLASVTPKDEVDHRGIADSDEEIIRSSDKIRNVEITGDSDSEPKYVDIKKDSEKVITRSSDKFRNVGITSDSDTEPSYVYVKKDNDEEITRSSDKFRGVEIIGNSDSEPNFLDNKKDNVNEITRSSGDSDTVPNTVDANSRSNGHLRQVTETDSAIANAEEASGESSESLYSNVQSSFSNRSGLDASVLDSPLGSPPSCSSQSIEQLLEADAARLRKKWESAEKDILIPSTPNSRISSTTQSPQDAARGFKRFLSFGKKNKGNEVTIIECTSPSIASLVDDDSMSGGWQSGDSIKPRMGSSAATSDDLDNSYIISPHDNSYIISPHVHSSQSFVPASPAKSELKEIVPPAKSPKAHRSFFSLPSFKCNGSHPKHS